MALRARSGLWLLALLSAAACSGHSAAVKQSAPVTQVSPPPTVAAPTTTTTTLAPTYPLTGRPAPDPAKRARSAAAVKIDNIDVARPQAGISAADVVYEEYTEGITRFIVVFQSGDAEAVGPVRSVRPADPNIVTPLGGVLAFSGGSPAAVALATATPLTIVTENNVDVLYRRSTRSAPQNLYTSTVGLYSKAPADAHAPPPFAAFLAPGQAYAAAGATPASELSVVPAPYVTADYTWEPAGGYWNRFTDGRPHRLEEGGQIAPANIIVQFTPYRVFTADEKVMYPEVLGTGDAWIFAAGTIVHGTWSKPAAEAVTTFADAAGAPIVLPPGQTWVHLVAPGSYVSSG